MLIRQYIGDPIEVVDKVSTKAIRAFNAGAALSANDNWNKAQGYGTLAENRLCLIVQNAKYGPLGERHITQKDITEYLKENEVKQKP